MLAAAVARMRTAKRQEQSPAHGVPYVPSRAQGWFSRGPAEERRATAAVAGLMRGVLPPMIVAAVRPNSQVGFSCGVCARGEQKRVCISGLICVIGEEDGVLV